MFPIGEPAPRGGSRLLFLLSWFPTFDMLAWCRQLFNAHQMANLGHHSPDRRVVWTLNRRMKFAQTQRGNRPSLIGRPTNRTPH